MYAIIRTGGKQAKVREGDIIDVERLKKAEGEIEFTPLLVVDEKGTAVTDREQLAAFKVKAEIIGDTKGDKIDIFKYKNKTGYRRRMGHRQIYTTIKVTEIAKPKAKRAAKAEASTAPAAETEAKQSSKAATSKAAASKPATSKAATAAAKKATKTEEN